jgi:hypothetical protein
MLPEVCPINMPPARLILPSRVNQNESSNREVLLVLTGLRSKLTYANVMATIAVFLVLTGIGFAVAKLPKRSVGAKQLKNGAVHTKKIHANAVNASKIKSGAVGRSEIASGAVSTSEISNQAVTRNKIADSAIPLLGTLRSGQTLRGVFNIGAGANGTVFRDGQSFQFPLNNAPSAPAANIIDASVASPAFTSNCSGLSGGNNQTPLSAAGQLCVYITFKSVEFSTLAFDSGALTRLGFGLTATFGSGDTTNQVRGQWAVTAP